MFVLRTDRYLFTIQSITLFLSEIPLDTTDWYVGLEPTKNCSPSRVLEAGEPGASSKGNPWNPYCHGKALPSVVI